MADLSELEVVITRPLAQAEQWRQALRGRGATTHLLPVLEIVPIADPADLHAVKNRILALADYSKVIFVSQNAVQQAVTWIDQYWPQQPVGIQYFAVGSTTARAACEQGLRVEAASHAMNSEALLQLPALQAVKDEKVLICRGVGGRTHLGEQLFQRGARVDYCELYHRRLPADAAQRYRQLIGLWEHSQAAAGKRVVAVHSGESLQNLRQLMDDTATPALQDAVLLVPGARVAELASHLGFRRILVAENATDEAMTRALTDGI